VGDLRRRADEGDVRSMNELANAYTMGRLGLKQDSAISFHWYKKAADADDSHGLTMAALLSLIGEGVQRDDAAAMLMMARAAMKGDKLAREAVVRWLELGERGLTADPAQAQLWRGGQA